MKNENLTVRIDPALKRRAQEVSKALDVSLSQVVTAALKGLCRGAPRTVGALVRRVHSVGFERGFGGFARMVWSVTLEAFSVLVLSSWTGFERSAP